MLDSVKCLYCVYLNNYIIFIYLFIYYFFKRELYLFIYLFIYLLLFWGCVGSSLLHAGFLYLRRAGATPHRGVWVSHCRGFSCCRARALGTRASVVVARGLRSCGSWALEHRLSSWGAQAY